MRRSREMTGHRMTSLGIAHRSRRLAITACLGALALFGVAAPARAEFGVKPGTFTAQLLDATDTEQTQAGSHPDRFVTSFEFNTIDVPDPNNPGSTMPITDE